MVVSSIHALHGSGTPADTSRGESVGEVARLGAEDPGVLAPRHFRCRLVSPGRSCRGDMGSSPHFLSAHLRNPKVGSCPHGRLERPNASLTLARSYRWIQPSHPSGLARDAPSMLVSIAGPPRFGATANGLARDARGMMPSASIMRRCGMKAYSASRSSRLRWPRCDMR
jgi:hypothetical protein